MRKRTWGLVLVLLVAAVWCATAYASTTDGNNTFWPDMWNSIGSFLYNTLPWNWGAWAGPNST